MICCTDEHLKTNAVEYFNLFIKKFVQFSICNLSAIPSGHLLKVHPYIITDAISTILSNENKIISEFGEIAIEIVINELFYVLGNDVCISYPNFFFCVLKNYIFFLDGTFSPYNSHVKTI